MLEPQLLSVRVQNLVAWVTCPVFVHSAFALTSMGVDLSLVRILQPLVTFRTRSVGYTMVLLHSPVSVCL
jgi:hypothetical protein